MRFRLGYVSEPLVGHEYLRNRLAIPYLTPAGVVEIKFRRIDDSDGPKYLYQSGSTSERIFNPQALFDDRDYICVCEGELDAITAEQCGIPAVGIPGVDNWQPFFAKVFAGYDRVLILGDADDSGQGEGFANDLARLIPNSRVVLMPDGHDVNSFYMAEGSDALRRKAGIEDDR
jgi:DNA primase